MTRGRPRQYSISVKVSAEQKKAFAERCAAAGVSQSEMVERALTGISLHEHPLPAVAREHLALVHEMRAALAAKTPIDAAGLAGITAATKELITVIRRDLSG